MWAVISPADPRALPVFEQIIATKKQREAGHAQTTQLMTIWFGGGMSIRS